MFLSEKRVFCKGVFKNFAKFKEERLCCSHFLIKYQAQVYWKVITAQMFSCEIWEIFRDIDFIEI